MLFLSGCCCFVSLKTGSRVSAFFSLATAIINIIIDLMLLIRLTEFMNNREPQEVYLYLPPGGMVFLGIELILNLIMIPISFLLLIGINYEFEGKNWIFSWIFFIIGDRLYDFFMGVYSMAWIGGHRFRDVLYPFPETIVISIYWLINTFIMILCILCILSYWRELKNDLFGKERRVKHYNKLANIRQAALSGMNTPYKSYYSSKSMLQLSQSQNSIFHP